MEMDDNQRLQLQNMIKVNNVVDQTELIRNLKHSQVLRNEVNNMIMIKNVLSNVIFYSLIIPIFLIK